MPMTSTPVAIGSSVPAWPTRRVRARRRTRATTSCEVMPPGLSTMTRPDGHGGGRAVSWVPGRRESVSSVPLIWASVGVVVLVVLVVFRPVFLGLLVRIRVAGPLGALGGAGQLLVLLPGGQDQLVDPLRVLRQLVGDELDRRGVPQADQPAHLGADDAGRALQRDGGLLP